MSYFVLKSSEDGFRVTVMTKEQIVKELAEDGSGYSVADVVSEIPPEPDPNYWGNTLVIIKGEVVEPEPIHVIETFHLP